MASTPPKATQSFKDKLKDLIDKLNKNPFLSTSVIAVLTYLFSFFLVAWEGVELLISLFILLFGLFVNFIFDLVMNNSKNNSKWIKNIIIFYMTFTFCIFYAIQSISAPEVDKQHILIGFKWIIGAVITIFVSGFIFVLYRRFYLKITWDEIFGQRILVLLIAVLAFVGVGSNVVSIYIINSPPLFLTKPSTASRVALFLPESLLPFSIPAFKGIDTNDVFEGEQTLLIECSPKTDHQNCLKKDSKEPKACGPDALIPISLCVLMSKLDQVETKVFYFDAINGTSHNLSSRSSNLLQTMYKDTGFATDWTIGNVNQSNIVTATNTLRELAVWYVDQHLLDDVDSKYSDLSADRISKLLNNIEKDFNYSPNISVECSNTPQDPIFLIQIPTSPNLQQIGICDVFRTLNFLLAYHMEKVSEQFPKDKSGSTTFYNNALVDLRKDTKIQEVLSQLYAKQDCDQQQTGFWLSEGQLYNDIGDFADAAKTYENFLNRRYCNKPTAQNDETQNVNKRREAFANLLLAYFRSGRPITREFIHDEYITLKLGDKEEELVGPLEQYWVQRGYLDCKQSLLLAGQANTTCPPLLASDNLWPQVTYGSCATHDIAKASKLNFGTTFDFKSVLSLLWLRDQQLPRQLNQAYPDWSQLEHLQASTPQSCLAEELIRNSNHKSVEAYLPDYQENYKQWLKLGGLGVVTQTLSLSAYPTLVNLLDQDGEIAASPNLSLTANIYLSPVASPDKYVEGKLEKVQTPTNVQPQSFNLSFNGLYPAGSKPKIGDDLFQQQQIYVRFPTTISDNDYSWFSLQTAPRLELLLPNKPTDCQDNKVNNSCSYTLPNFGILPMVAITSTISLTDTRDAYTYQLLADDIISMTVSSDAKRFSSEGNVKANPLLDFSLVLPGTLVGKVVTTNFNGSYTSTYGTALISNPVTGTFGSQLTFWDKASKNSTGDSLNVGLFVICSPPDKNSSEQPSTFASPKAYINSHNGADWQITPFVTLNKALAVPLMAEPGPNGKPGLLSRSCQNVDTEPTVIDIWLVVDARTPNKPDQVIPLLLNGSHKSIRLLLYPISNPQ